jgi:ketosteroid isomerase-like protein
MLFQPDAANAMNEPAMPITLFYHFVITFADAISRDDRDAGKIDRLYRIVESPQHRWVVSENGQPVSMADAQQAQLGQLLDALSSLPDPAIEPIAFGSDGTWVTVVIQTGDQQIAYRWWSLPPAEWAKLAAITQFVQQIADAPRLGDVARQQQIARQFFAHLAARDLPQMLALYHPDIHYSNVLLELDGAQVGAMWRMVWSDLPDLRVVCTDHDIRGSSVYWQASYTYPPTGRYVVQHLAASLTFADGLIIGHVDRFNVHEWAHKAYGAAGGMFGGWQVFERWIAEKARRRLAAFLRQQPSHIE